MSGTEILIAGATGTNGRQLLEQLSSRGVPSRALVRDLEKAADLAGPCVKLIKGDLADAASLEPAFDGVEKAYIVTAVHRDSEQWFDNFFNVAKAAGVRHLVKFSAYGAGKESPSEIIRGHGRSDRVLIDSGIPYTILRPNSFCQNLLWQAESIRKQGQFFLPAGDAKQSMIDVRDIAEATANILTGNRHIGNCYDLTGPESLSYHDVAKVLSELLGKSMNYVPVSVEASKSSMLRAGMPEWDARVLSEIQGVFGLGLFSHVEADLPRLLGRAPRTFRQFANEYKADFE